MLARLHIGHISRAAAPSLEATASPTRLNPADPHTDARATQPCPHFLSSNVPGGAQRGSAVVDTPTIGAPSAPPSPHARPGR